VNPQNLFLPQNQWSTSLLRLRANLRERPARVLRRRRSSPRGHLPKADWMRRNSSRNVVR
jgi:hypothetical protein